MIAPVPQERAVVEPGCPTPQAPAAMIPAPTGDIAGARVPPTARVPARPLFAAPAAYRPRTHVLEVLPSLVCIAAGWWLALRVVTG